MKGLSSPDGVPGFGYSGLPRGLVQLDHVLYDILIQHLSIDLRSTVPVRRCTKGSFMCLILEIQYPLTNPWGM